MSLVPTRNNIIFQFVESVNTKGQFEETKSTGGIVILGDFDKSAKTSRWARIVRAGHECSEYIKQEGIEILIENLRWTEGIEHNGETFWKTDETQILAYRQARG